MANKRVEFNAVDNGVSQMMQRLRQQSEQMSRELIQDAQQYTQSGKEQVRYIEDQIKAIERRNQLEKEQRQLVAQQTRQQKEQQATTAGEAQQAREQYQEQIQQIQVESKEDEMQTKLLRELIEVTKQTAQEEIRADKQGTRREIRSTERAMQRGEDVDPEEAFKRAYQKEQLGTVREEEDEEERRFRGLGQRATRTVGAVPGMAAAGSETALLAGGVGALLGVGAGSLVNQYFQRGSQYEEARLSAQAQMRQNFIGQGQLLDMTRLGMAGAETYGFGTELARQRGGARMGQVGNNLQQAVQGLVSLQELYNVERQTLMQRAGVERSDISRQGTFQDIQSTVMALQEAGAFQGGDFTRLDELVNIQTQMMQQQRQYREETDSNRIASLMSDMMRVGGSFSDDRMIQRMQGMDQALRSPQNEFAQAFQLSTLRQLNPNMGYFDIMREQERGIMSEGYLNTAMRRIMQMPGGEQMQQEQLYQMFGGNLSRAATSRLFESFQGDQDLFTNFSQRAQELQGQGLTREQAFQQAAEQFVGVRQRQEARVGLSVEQAGDEMFQLVEKMFGEASPIAGFNDKVKSGIEWLGEFSGAIEDSTKAIKEAQRTGIIGGTGKIGNEKADVATSDGKE